MVAILPKYENMLKREKETVSYMIDIYCKDHHKTASDLCPDCKQAKELVVLHLTKCPFQERKTACGRCGLRCYSPTSKTKVEAIMNYAGPRMALRHPGLALHHLWDARRSPGKLETKE
jgi:hypothetical protein